MTYLEYLDKYDEVELFKRGGALERHASEALIDYLDSLKLSDKAVAFKARCDYRGLLGVFYGIRTAADVEEIVNEYSEDNEE